MSLEQVSPSVPELSYQLKTITPSGKQLKSDVAEFAAFLAQAKGARVKGVLTTAKAEAEREIVNLEMKAKIAEERKAAGSGDAKRSVTGVLQSRGSTVSPTYSLHRVSSILEFCYNRPGITATFIIVRKST